MMIPTQELEKVNNYLRGELAKIRAGRASVDLVEGIEVDVYNSKLPIRQLATLSCPEPRLILIQPWDKSIIKKIEGALRSEISGINPIIDNDVIRIPFPAPTEERRQELVKEVDGIVEGARIRIRQIREEALGKLKEKKEKGEISEDEFFRNKEEIQRSVDDYNSKVDELGQKKASEIMTI